MYTITSLRSIVPISSISPAPPGRPSTNGPGQITSKTVLFPNAPGGLPGNDDLGALSSWYVFSAMGFYPVTIPSRPLYELGSPIFKTGILHLPNGRDFTLLAPASSTRNRYIQSATLNGRPHQRPWITHQDLLSGGTLVLNMGPVPDKRWGAAPEAAPPSQTTGQPDMRIGEPSLTKVSAAALGSSPSITTASTAPSALAADTRLTTPAGTPVQWRCLVTNKGAAAGSISLALRVDGQPYATKTILLNAGDSEQVSIPVTLYRAGLHTITLGKTGLLQRLAVQARPPALVFSDLSLPLPPVLRRTDSFSVSAWVKNTGSTTSTAGVNLFIDHHPHSQQNT